MGFRDRTQVHPGSATYVQGKCFTTLAFILTIILVISSGAKKCKTLDKDLICSFFLLHLSPSNTHLQHHFLLFLFYLFCYAFICIISLWYSDQTQVSRHTEWHITFEARNLRYGKTFKTQKKEAEKKHSFGMLESGAVVWRMKSFMLCHQRSQSKVIILDSSNRTKLYFSPLN